MIEIRFIPETLSEAQRDMTERMPREDASAWERAAYHRYNAEMFRMAGERLARSGRSAGDDFSAWCRETQQNAVRTYMLEFYRALLAENAIASAPNIRYSPRGGDERVRTLTFSTKRRDAPPE